MEKQKKKLEIFGQMTFVERWKWFFFCEFKKNISRHKARRITHELLICAEKKEEGNSYWSSQTREKNILLKKKPEKKVKELICMLCFNNIIIDWKILLL